MSDDPVVSGPLELAEDPVGPFDAATKRYVDAAAELPDGLATEQYVDDAVAGADTELPDGFDGGGSIDPGDPNDVPQNVALVGALRTATVVWASMGLGGLGGYEVQVDSTNTFDSGNLQEGTTRGTVKSFGDLSPGNVYYARVRATDASGNTSGWSSIATATLAQVSDDDIVADTITGDRIKVGTLNGDRIEVGTLDADVIGAGKIDAQYIDVDSITISGDAVVGGTLDANDVTISNLTVDELSGTTISAFDFIRASDGQTLKITDTALVEGITRPALEWTKSGEWTEATIGAAWHSNGSVDLILRAQLGKVIIDGGIEKKQAGELASESWVSSNYATDSHSHNYADEQHSHSNYIFDASDAFSGEFSGDGDGHHMFRTSQGGLKMLDNTAGLQIRNGADTVYRPLKAASFDTGSDRRFKKGIRQLDEPELSKVKSCKPSFFTFEEQEREDLGFIADEVPLEAYTADENGDGGYSLNAMLAVLWKAVQELADELDSRMSVLENRQ